jgi:hypothetical protein
MTNLFRDSSNASPSNTFPVPFDALYARLDPQHVEQFYQGYAHWHMRQQYEELELQRARVDQQIADNAVLMQLAQPSALSLAVLTRLQSYGVEDIDLLDTLLERGDEWLDHAMQHLEQCEQLDLIHGNYTEWCRHALDGAYDWLDTMNQIEPLETGTSTPSHTAIAVSTTYDETTQVEHNHEVSDEITAEQLLRKLMSDDETEKMPTLLLGETQQTQGQQPEEQPTTTHDEAVSQAPENELTPSSSVTSETPIQHTGEIALSQESQQAHEPQEQPVQGQDDMQPEVVKTQKLPGRSLVSRILARVWNV